VVCALPHSVLGAQAANLSTAGPARTFGGSTEKGALRFGLSAEQAISKINVMKVSKTPVILLLGPLFFLGGCATPTEYRTDASHPIRTITVEQNVPVPKRMEFVGFSEAMGVGLAGGLGGAIGAGVAAANLYSREGSADFDVGQSVRVEFIAAIQRSGKFTIKTAGPADADLQLRVTGYGFHEAAMFGRRVRPILSIEAKLIRADGKVIWQHRRAITHLTGDTPAILPEKIRDNPKLGADALRVAARLCADAAVESVRQ
jgi:hypothetical protein